MLGCSIVLGSAKSQSIAQLSAAQCETTQHRVGLFLYPILSYTMSVHCVREVQMATCVVTCMVADNLSLLTSCNAIDVSFSRNTPNLSTC